MLLNNTLFNVETLLSELDQEPREGLTALVRLQRKLINNYFKDISDSIIKPIEEAYAKDKQLLEKEGANEDALKELDQDKKEKLAKAHQEILLKIEEKLKEPGFNEFPRLQYVLQQVFSGQPNFVIPENLQDWQPTVTFKQLNEKYRYFNQDLSPLFQRLAIACKKMTNLIENQVYDDEMAYKLMTLFYDPSKSDEKNFVQISQDFDNLIKKRDRTINTPYHDAFVTELNTFPKLSDIRIHNNKDTEKALREKLTQEELLEASLEQFMAWKTFIKKEGFKSLKIFASCAKECTAFSNMDAAKDFLLTQTYKNAQENLVLAKICKKMGVSNNGFEAGLQEVKSGWPKKQTDNLPDVQVEDETKQYFWVKLPPQDMHALYLGKTTGCCQLIDGSSSQCVKDGIRLTENGFYVLLKRKTSSNELPHLIKNGQINDKDFSIVAQSYAWKTNNSNLCLDSIEWDKERLTKDIIKDIMMKFSEAVFKKHPDIKHITVGSGGQTPCDMFLPCDINETMKQGYLYGDAAQQYHIECNIHQDVLHALTERLQDVRAEYHNTILYLAPYFDVKEIKKVPHELMGVLNELSKNLSKINLPPNLSTDDFKKISFEDYQNMDESAKSRISTVCKLLNSQNEEDLRKWLPTIPAGDLRYISLMKNEYTLEFISDVFQRLPREHQLATIYQLDNSNNTLLLKISNIPHLLQMILDLYPENQRLMACIEQNKDRHGYGESPLMKAAANPDSLRIIIGMLTKNQLIEAVQLSDRNEHTTLHYASKNPESLKMILEIFPENQRLAVVANKSAFAQSTLMYAARNINCLRTILELLPDNQRLAAIKEKNIYRDSPLMIAANDPESLRTILKLLPDDHRLEALKDQDNLGVSILMKIQLQSNPDARRIIFETLPKETALVITTCMNHLGKDFEKPSLSLLRFIENMKHLAPPNRIDNFVQALMNDDDIKPPLYALLSSSPALTFFKSHSKADIQNCINQLDDYWLSRIEKVEKTDFKRN